MTNEECIERMDRKLKCNNCILIAVVLAAVLTIIAGAASRKDVIEARAFEVVDVNGNVRASLKVVKDVPKLSLFDQDGNLIWQAP